MDENTPQPPAGGDPPPPGGSVPSPPPPSGATPPPPAQTPAPPPQPPAGAQQPQYASPAATAQAPGKAGGGSKTGLIIGIVVIILLLCCCGSTALGWYFYAQAEQEILDSVTDSVTGTTDGTSGTSGTTDSGASDVEAGEVVTVYASWSAPEDLDLEIWDEAGDVPLFPAYQLTDVDIVDGAQGEEYFEFKAYDSGDYSSGKYTASVYFNGDMDAEPVDVTVTVVRPDGSSDSITNSVEWDPALDQWHALVVDAETGEVEYFDEYW